MTDEPTQPRLSEDTPNWFRSFVDTGWIPLIQAVKDTKEVSLSNSRAIRGYDGKPGLVTEISVLEEKVTTLELRMSSFLKTSTTIIVFVVTTLIGVVVYHVMSTP
ncbi:hypothetical protein AC477_01110 [miscellaneous Crenarchaeota group-1 archaeon SG8-32-1]|uniref:Uncharacterized protein n=1 Tax=miscellaneous Crenarchaeota group-1 archaeon SG8-32-1 TaxID=1685124 RepID=A0A0M0BZJ9_9ARCH|nr:MAG: hypothetical protein AC477_01110 [miscellaneous Crenarchaeota group-1 archaeon SG8-32-1]